ncbi:MAG: hypothetical protein HETSPECPRED_009086 [Heterodermia speciosa]|uniref:NTP binding protein n=1 Tax=Heterodermia speciosa TaxID=116794 RepID=A0A8H3FXG8_9LECA|nr:MAG: hypothetical protein HETSPECPRED_009086 [Heterodermia speciosa]
MNPGVRSRRHDGRDENLVEPLHDGHGPGGTRITFGSRYSHSIFRGFKHEPAASMKIDDPLRRESPVPNVDAKKSLRHGPQIDTVRHPNERARTSTTSDPVRFVSTWDSPDGIASQCDSPPPQPSYRKRPQGPRAAPADRIKLKSDDKYFQQTRHSNELSPSRTSADPPEYIQAARCPTTEVRRSELTTSSYRGSRGTDLNITRLFTKEDASTAELTRPREVMNKSGLHQSGQSDRYPACTQQQDGMKIVENTTFTAPVEAEAADAATDHAPTKDPMRTKSVLRLLGGLRTVVSRAEQKLQKLAVLSDLGIWQRVMEMVLHVFSTLHHASPALHVLRSTNARPSEYGKALKDFCRAIIYLLVLLSLLQLVAHAVRIVFMVVAALAWPFRLIWFVLKWVGSG